MSVASVTDQRSVADCPRSMEVGSALKEMLGAFGGGGVSFTAGGGGGGGAGGGTFFLHPAANNASSTPNQITLTCRLLNMN
jgi:hypothetical protein